MSSVVSHPWLLSTVLSLTERTLPCPPPPPLQIVDYATASAGVELTLSDRHHYIRARLSARATQAWNLPLASLRGAIVQIQHCHFTTGTERVHANADSQPSLCLVIELATVLDCQGSSVLGEPVDVMAQPRVRQAVRAIHALQVQKDADAFPEPSIEDIRHKARVSEEDAAQLVTLAWADEVREADPSARLSQWSASAASEDSADNQHSLNGAASQGQSQAQSPSRSPSEHSSVSPLPNEDFYPAHVANLAVLTPPELLNSLDVQLQQQHTDSHERDSTEHGDMSEREAVDAIDTDFLTQAPGTLSEPHSLSQAPWSAAAEPGYRLDSSLPPLELLTQRSPRHAHSHELELAIDESPVKPPDAMQPPPAAKRARRGFECCENSVCACRADWSQLTEASGEARAQGTSHLVIAAELLAWVCETMIRSQ